MPTSDARRAPVVSLAPDPIWDARFAKWFVIACGCVPAALLLWDAARHQLGVNDVNFAIRTTGLLGLVFLSLSLMITPLRRLTGWTALIAVRRNLGVFGFSYIAGHFLLFFVFDRDMSVTSTLDEIVEREYLWYGTGALVIMIPLAITSTDAMVSRLGAKRWKLLHRTAYLAVLGGVIHYYQLVKADTTKPMIFATVFGGLMLYRGVMHYVDLRREVAVTHTKLLAAKSAARDGKKRPFWSGELVVARIFHETHDVKTFRLTLPDGGVLPFEHTAGQYLNVALTIAGARVNRSYTIASSPTRNRYVEISVKRAADGYASHYLHDQVREGMRLRIGAPAGKFVFAGHEAKRVVLLAGGVGITPMMAVVRSLTDRCWAGEIYLVFSIRTGTDIVFARELEDLQARFSNLHVTITLSAEPADSPWTGARGHITKALVADAVPELTASPTAGPVLVCGPAPMMTAMRTLLVDLGVPNDDILEEAFVSPKATAAALAGDAAAMTGDAGVAADTTVQFARAKRAVEVPGGLTVLEAAEDCGVAIAFECRSGICGQCKTKLVSGRVTMEVQDALSVGDKARGLILACQARPLNDVIVDA